jgi:hypothetical protein
MVSSYSSLSLSFYCSSKRYKKASNRVISPILIRSPFNIHDSPKYISIERISKITSIYYLRHLEYEYDNFLEKKFQILLLLNVIDEVLEIRDKIIRQINVLRRN